MSGTWPLSRLLWAVFGSVYYSKSSHVLGLSVSRTARPPLPPRSNNENSNSISKQANLRVLAQKGDSSASVGSGIEVRDEGKNGVNEENIENLPKQNSGLRRLAQLSLEDYKWRTSLFKTREADRKMEESLARMIGDEATYVRPMDAGEKKIGPLGRAEKIAVDWLERVIYEEGRRAEQIVSSKGSMVRPKDAASPDGQLGPLGFMEKQFVDLVAMIKASEKERARTKTIRPKDLDESMRGPLGEAELRAVSAIREVLDSERLRVMQSRARGGDVVRPIDVPGPLGEFEMALLDVVKSEKQRGIDREDTGKLVRPMDSSMKGPLGELERRAVDAVKTLTNEEKERLRNIQLVLDRNRPMQQEEKSALGIFEASIVGIIRAIGFIFGFAATLYKSGDSPATEERNGNK